MSSKNKTTNVEALLASSHTTPSEGYTAETLAAELAAGLQQYAEKAAVDVYQLPPCLMILLVTEQWCTCANARDLPRLLRGEVNKRMRYKVPLLGGSMARLYCSTDPKPDIERGAAVAMLCSNDLRVIVGSVPSAPKDARERWPLLRDLAEELDRRSREQLGLGSSADRDLLAFFPGYRDNREETYDHDLFGEVTAAFERKYPLYGVSAANGMRSTTGYQFADDKWMQSGLAIGLIETDIRLGAAMEHGFHPLDEDRVSIDQVEGGDPSHRVIVIDGEPARKRLRDLQKKHSFAPGMPVLGTFKGPNYEITLPLGGLEGESPVFLSRRVRKGDRLYLLDAAPGEMLQASELAFQSASKFAKGGQGRIPLKLAISFPCALRSIQYEKAGFRWEEIVGKSHESLGGAPLFVGLGAGEFGRDQWQTPRSDGMSVWVVAIADGQNARAGGRQQSGRLRNTVDRVFQETTAKGVMLAALQGAVDAGAKGGQICVVDKATDRILGLHRGVAYGAEGSLQNWALALSQTDRLRPSEAVSGPLGMPRSLKPFSVRAEMQQNASSPYEYQPKKPDDILWLSVLTQQAIFVRDAWDPMFFNDVDLAKKCNIRTYLVLPLPGSANETIATMQVGFHDLAEMDREVLSFWVGHGQKVGQALERAFEAEHRVATERLAEKLAEITQRQISGDWTPREEVKELLDTLSAAMPDAEYIHARLRVSPGEDTFHLVSPNGKLSPTHQHARPSIRIGEGTCDPHINKDRGVFTNVTVATIRWLQDRKSFACTSGAAPGVEAAWRHEIGETRSNGIVPLWIAGEFEGALTVSSLREYYFGERQQKLLLIAARTVQELVANRRSAWEKHHREGQRGRIDGLKNDLTTLLLEASSPRGDWGPVLKRIREGFLCEKVVYRYVEKEKPSEEAFWSSNTGSLPVQLFRLPEQEYAKLIADPRVCDVFDVNKNYIKGHFLEGLNSALTLSAAAGGTVHGILALGDRIRGQSPFDFYDAVERRGALDVASALASTTAERASRAFLEQSAQMMKDAIKIGAAGLFGSLVIHQLNTGLGVINGNLEKLMEQKDAPAAKRDRWLQIISDQRKQLVNVVQELVARPTVGLQREQLRNLVRLALGIVQPDRNRQVKLHLANKVSRSVHVDIWQVVMAIVNVLENAMEAIGNEGGELTVSTDVDGESGVIRVRNTGEPPPLEVLGRMFEPGLSSKNTEGTPHLGLGLALSRGAVQTAGGSITYEIPGDGLFEVVIRLPLVFGTETPRA